MSLEIKDKFFDYLAKDGFFEEGNIKDFIFFAYEDTIGILYSNPALSSAHDCNQCQDEILAFALRGPSKDIPRYFSVGVEAAIFAKIKSGWRDSKGFNLKKVIWL
jgi:hypothetical protein